MIPTIQLANGRYLDLVNPQPESFDADSVATSLAKTCRFNGHCEGFYSVAEHCVLAARAFYGVNHNTARLALHHEDDEVGTGDISGPLKLLIGDALKPIAERIRRAAWDRFDIDDGGDVGYRAVKTVDLRLLVTEKRDLMPTSEEDPHHWKDSGVRPFTRTFDGPSTWYEARAAWLAHWSYLMPDGYALGGPFCSQVLPMSAGWLEYDLIKYKTWDNQTRKAVVHDSLINKNLRAAFDQLSFEGPLT